MTIDTGIIIAILSLALTIGGAIAMFGRFQGKVTEKTEKNGNDIDKLWSHQRGQDKKCSTINTNNAKMFGKLSATLKAVQDNTRETKQDVKDIRKEIFNIRGTE